MNEKITGINILISFIVAMTTSAIVFLCLWNWFISPLGVMELTFTHSLGLIIFILWIKYDSSKESDITWKDIIEGLVLKAFVLGLGFLTHYVGI